MTFVIDRLHAATPPGPPLLRMPGNLGHQNVLLDTVKRLNLVVPGTMQAAADSGKPLRDSGHQFTVEEVDRALAKGSFSTDEKMRLKAGMRHAGIIAR
jgi:hypothetical protein